ncbi:DUF1835 domain-containing protein [Neobacillus sp. DY30]|uniref:DUF1835 domain-containing protein n=1 Tax=Neobacillus sp. DY30 TaxID=3047871 RepID=UPI0024C0041D|nr:DUF1835 domain-containing protein [Neobacillus sp. DY30]WHX97973.1 DUF1835 domain-containing protein [Neobacillus sp. DY30]
MDILDIKNIVKDLPEKEVRSYLQFILYRIALLEDKENSLVELANDLKEIFNEILYPEVTELDPFGKSDYKKVNIQFGYPYLRQPLKELNLLKEELSLAFHDNFSIAPLYSLDSEKGQTDRFYWLKNNLSNEYEVEFYKKSFPKIISQLLSIPEKVPIYIWVSENANEQTALLFTMFLLRERKNSIYIIDTATLYRKLFEKKAKKYVPFFSGEIILEELQTIYTYSQENKHILSDIEREHYEKKWLALSNNPSTLRIWENGEIKVVAEDYYDDFIIEKAKKLIGKKKGFIMCARLVGEVYGHILQYIGDGFLEYRVRKLIEKGIFEYEGSLEAMRYYGIKLSKSFMENHSEKIH